MVFHHLSTAGKRLGTSSSLAALSERNSGRLLHQVMICLFAIYGARRRLWVIGIWRLVNKRRQGWNSNCKKACLGLKKTTIKPNNDGVQKGLQWCISGQGANVSAKPLHW